jgi:putative phage-type endonuclease
MDPNTVIDRLLRGNVAVDNVQVATIASVASACRVTAHDVERRLENHAAWGAIASELALQPQPAQRSAEWFATRNDMITASDIAQALGHGKFGTQREFFEKKVDPASSKFDASAPPLQWGIRYEQVANMLYCKRNNVGVREFGLLKHPRVPHIGASPDGISDDGIMVEIKCPWRRQVDGQVPEQYYYQIQFQLDTCGLDECDYIDVKLGEYRDEAAFLDDVDEPGGALTRDGAEKGIVIGYHDDAGNRKYEYGDIAKLKTADEVAEWKRRCIMDVPTGATDVTVYYWRVDKLMIKRIYRDDTFIEDNLPEIARVWERVLRYRADRQAYEAEVVAAKRKPRVPKGAPPSPPRGCVLGDD